MAYRLARQGATMCKGPAELGTTWCDYGIMCGKTVCEGGDPHLPICPSHKQLLLLVPIYLSRASLYKNKGIEIYIPLFGLYYTKMEHIVHTLLCSFHQHCILEIFPRQDIVSSFF